jgi:hypothetical protein
VAAKIGAEDQLVHHIAHDAGEKLTLEEFIVRLPQFRRAHFSGASPIMVQISVHPTIPPQCDAVPSLKKWFTFSRVASRDFLI